MIKVKVPATSANLGPGFDYVGMALEMYNEFYFFDAAEEEMPQGSVQLAEKSLAHQAFRLAFSELRREAPKLRIAIKANIPRTRGLGSSATLTIAGLAAANFINGGLLKEEDLISMATTLEGHPDNAAPALLGGVVVCMVVADSVKYLKFMPQKQLKVVAAVPEFELATADARRVLPRKVSHKDAADNTGRFGFFIASLLTGDYRHLAFAMEDLLHQPYRQKLVPGMEEVMAAALESGALGSCLSGAGPTVLALCDSRFTEVSSQMIRTWEKQGIKASAYTLAVAKEGAACEILQSGFKGT